MNRFHKAIGWLKRHPTAALNLFFILWVVIGTSYLLVKPIDVLEDWTLSTSKSATNGQLPVYYPGSTLEFKSRSTKLQSAEGTSTRIFDCDANGSASAREIQLDSIPANRAPGRIAERENSIVIPAVTEFKKLPRTCRLVINVCYDNVILWRDHCESARTNDFLVQENSVDPAMIQKQIQDLRDQIKVLEDRALSALNSNSSSTSITTPNKTGGGSTTTTTTTTNNKAVAASPSPSPAPSPKPTPTPAPVQVCTVDLLGIKLLCN